MKSAFEDLLQQLNKHKEILRSSHKWTRRQKVTSARRTAAVPFEDTVAVVFPPTVSAEDVRVLCECKSVAPGAFCGTRNFFPRNCRQVLEDSISKDEVIDETVAAALGDSREITGKTGFGGLALSSGPGCAGPDLVR